MKAPLIVLLLLVTGCGSRIVAPASDGTGSEDGQASGSSFCSGSLAKMEIAGSTELVDRVLASYRSTSTPPFPPGHTPTPEGSLETTSMSFDFTSLPHDAAVMRAAVDIIVRGHKALVDRFPWTIALDNLGANDSIKVRVSASNSSSSAAAWYSSAKGTTFRGTLTAERIQSAAGPSVEMSLCLLGQGAQGSWLPIRLHAPSAVHHP